MPLVYNGQEVGGNQALDYFNDTKIDWTAKDDKMLNTLRTLFALKHAVPALSHAKQTADNPATQLFDVQGSTSVFAYTRTLGDSQVLVVLNMGTTDASATINGLTEGDWSLWLDSRTIAQGTSRQQVTLHASHTFDIEAKGYRVYVRGVYPEQPVSSSTGIRSVSASQTASHQWYSLSGRAIHTPTKAGIYIRDGKKYAVR